MVEGSATVPIGLCQCGCGLRTAIVVRNHAASGRVKGQPNRYVPGHQSRLSSLEYVIDPKTGCWIWQLGRTSDEYGCAKGTTAHRHYYERAKGPIPPGFQIDHLCRNHTCVNPAHLEAVPAYENTRRGLATKLTRGDVETIRWAHARGAKPSLLAWTYHVDRSQISVIVNNKSWRDSQCNRLKRSRCGYAKAQDA